MRYMAKRRQILLAILSVISLLFLLMSSGCDPVKWFRVDNQTDQTVSIYITGVYQNDVASGEIRRIGTLQIPPKPGLPPHSPYLVEAKTKDGKVVYSKEFTWQELDDMDWTIVIPPPPE
jgi:hypothetical protein